MYLGKVRDIPVYFSWTIFLGGLFFQIIIWGRHVQVDTWYSRAVLFYVMTLGIYIGIFFHELGHAIVSQRFGNSPSVIKLNGLGGLTGFEVDHRSPKEQFWICVAGPLASFLFALFVFCGTVGVLFVDARYTTLLTVDQRSLVLDACISVALIHLILGAFNLLPVLPLDGGWMLAAVAWRVTDNRLTGTATVFGLGLIAYIVYIVYWLTNGAFGIPPIVETYLIYASYAQVNRIRKEEAERKTAGSEPVAL